MKDNVIGKIYQTEDYDKFKRLRGNRDKKSVKKILKSINDVGYVLSPILVNEKFEVIDGQNRLDALRIAEMPVAYIMQEGIGIKECRALNTSQTNWTTEQFIASYAENEYADYKRLFLLIKDFKKQFGLDGILFMACPKMIPDKGGVSYTKIRNGEFKLSDERYEIARRRLTSSISFGFVDLKSKHEMASRSYWGAIAYAYEHQEVNVRELAQKLFENPLDIISTSGVVDQLRCFDDIYNKNKRAGARVYMSTDLLKRECISEV